jgi:hypothetical protein
MHKTIATFGVLGLIWLGYTAWPLYDIFVLVRAFETLNLETLTPTAALSGSTPQSIGAVQLPLPYSARA